MAKHMQSNLLGQENQAVQSLRMYCHPKVGHRHELGWPAQITYQQRAIPTTDLSCAYYKTNASVLQWDKVHILQTYIKQVSVNAANSRSWSKLSSTVIYKFLLLLT